MTPTSNSEEYFLTPSPRISPGLSLPQTSRLWRQSQEQLGTSPPHLAHQSVKCGSKSALPISQSRQRDPESTIFSVMHNIVARIDRVSTGVSTFAIVVYFHFDNVRNVCKPL